jgi:NAD(P)-dependent dehydrogenase (short-subunit alcohol dehydrogenase family)
MKRFANQRVLITGASQGIGRACVDLFTEEGAAVVGTWARDPQPAERTARETGATLVQADLGDAASLDRLWEAHAGAAGFDVLVLNAAYQKKARFAETDLPLLERTFQVNVLGNFHLAQRFIAARRAVGKPGTIVIHSSNQGEFVNPTGFAYSLSKAALNQMVRHLAQATVKDRIRVNGVVLGWFDTDGERKFYSAEQIREQAAGGIPMGRAGEPREAAKMTAFLAGDDSSYMTGSLVRLDGGFALAPDLGT